MHTLNSEKTNLSRLSEFPKVAAVIVSAIGAVALIGWVFNISFVTHFAPGWVAMDGASAVGFILSGMALWRLTRGHAVPTPKIDKIVLVCGVSIALIGALPLARYLFSVDLSLVQFLFSPKASGSAPIAGSDAAPNTALCFFFSGLALLTFDLETPRGFRPAQWLILTGGLIAILTLIGYCYRLLSVYRVGSVIPMALGTAIAFAVWCFGALGARPDRGVMRLITSPTSAGAMVRRLLPMAVLVPALLGGLRLMGEQAGYFEIESGVSIVALSTIIVFIGIIWWNAKLLYLADLNRIETEQRLAIQYSCTRVLADARNLQAALPRILQVICDFLGWPLGAAWVVDSQAKLLRCAEVWHSSSLQGGRFIELTKNTSFPLEKGLPGRVWAANQAVWIPEVAKDDNFPRAPAAAQAGLQSALGFPVRLGGEICAVLEFFSQKIERPDDALLEMLTAIGSQIGQFIERQKAEEQLRRTGVELARSNTDLQQFAYVASHDLFEPLRMVTSFLQLLKERCQGKFDRQSEEFIAFALDGAHRMKALINDLLAYSRLNNRDPALTFLPINCEQVLQSALVNLKVAIEESGALITHEPLPTVRGDNIQLTQVFQNLIGNAIKFHGNLPPKIHVRAFHEDGKWLFLVRDNGIGIDPKYFERIFEIFQRLHTRRDYAGTGMGLAICKKIIERHGGRMWVESSPGTGSTFFFTLPVMKEAN